MALFNKRGDKPQSPERPVEIKSRYQSARSTLIAVALFGLINIFMIAFDTGSYFLFSPQVPVIITSIGYAFYYGNAISTVTYGIFIGVSAVICLLYLLAWYKSKDKTGWLIFALVLFVIDCLAFIGNFNSDMIMDLIFHALVLFSLVSGVSDIKNVKRARQEAAELAMNQSQYTGWSASDYYPSESSEDKPSEEQ